MSWRFKNIALVALCCALTTGLSAWADTTKPNPVTGETETYVNAFIGTTAEWNAAGNWDTGNVPSVSGGDFNASLVTNKAVSTSTAIDGWTLRVGAYDGASITWNGGITKIQGSTTGCWLTADETSKITIASFAGGQLENNGNAVVFKLTSANAGGITWSSGLSSNSGYQNLEFQYYLGGDGTVVYGGDVTVNNPQVIKQADITLSGTSQVTNKTLVTFGTGTTTSFSADAAIKRLNSSGTDLGNNAVLTELNTTGVTTLTTADEVGKCELVKTSTGIDLYWVDGDPSDLPPATVYKPSININFTNGAGNGLTTAADVGLSGYEVPGTSWNNYVVANATFSTVNAIDSTGKASVMSGVSVEISGTRGSYSCSNLTPASNPLHGYVDEAAANMTPTVTVTGIPYDKYRVIVYHSTDSANVPFGYDTINGTNYTYVSSALAEGTTAWGASGAQNGANAIAEGVNTLVISEATGSTLTVVGHREGGASNARGCIAAIQIIDDTNNLVIPVYGETEYSVDTAKNVSGTVYLIGNGTLTLTGTAKISAPTIDVGSGVTLNANADRLDGDAFVGSGTVAYNGVLPTTGKGWTEPTWSGTVWLKNYGAGGESTKVGVIGTDSGIADNNVMNGWGNANSSVKFTNVRGWCDTGSLPWTLILEDDGSTYAWYNNNGYSARETVFASLKGTGTLYDTGNTGCRQKITFTEASGFTGAFNVSGKRIGLGGSSTAANNATGSGSIEVVSGNSVTVSSDKVWTASGGIKVGGELRASGLARFGDSTTITTTDNGTFTLTDSNNTQDHAVDYARITGTGTLRYEDSTGWRTLSRVNFPTNMVCENNLSVGLILQALGQVHTIGSLSGNGRMRSDWGGSDNVGDRDLRVLQAKDTEYSGLFDDGTSASSWDRLRDVIVAPGSSTSGTLTLSGMQTATNGLVVESGASVNLTGTWVGATTVSGTFGGTGTLNGDLTFNGGSKFRVFALDEDVVNPGLSVSGTIAYPASGTVKVEIGSGVVQDDVYYIPLLSGVASADKDKFELDDTSLEDEFKFVLNGDVLGLERKSDYLAIYQDYVTFTLNNIGTTPITNYTLLVRISESQLPGFTYKSAGDGSKIAFSDGHGAPLSHEVDTWNTHGESLVWVKVPEAVNGTQVKFYWSLKDGEKNPENEPGEVWSDYAGVWHMDDAHDSTVNNAKGVMGPSASATEKGLFGGAIGATVTGINGALVTVETNAAINALADSGFTVSGWVCLNTLDADWAYLFTKKLIDGTDAWGLQFYGDNNGKAHKSRLWVGGSGYFTKNTPFVAGQWHYITLVFGRDGGSTIAWYMDGSAVQTTYSTAWSHGTDGFSIGGLPTGYGTLNGKMDEVRLRKGTVSTVQMQAEYANTLQTDFLGAVEGDGVSFLVPGAVVKDGIVKDYWLVKPSLSPASWDIGTSPSLTYTPGALRSGAAVTVTIETSAGTYLADFDGNTDFLLAISETGSYRLHFSRKDKTSGEAEDEYVYFTVTTPSGVDTVGDTAGGRILLMNNDFSQGGTATIGSQGYSDTNETEAVYWEFADREPSGITAMNVLDGTNSMLLAVNGAETNKLWHLVACRHGNTYPSGGSGLDDSQNYLPWSTMSCSLTNSTVAAQSGADAGQILMLNTTKAMVYSPCYTNGIGTIYFDAVNGWKGNIYNYIDDGDPSNTNAYQLVVEISTEAANVASEDIPDSEWTPLECHVVRVSASAPRLSEVAATTDIELAVADGGTTTEFYRIYATVEERGEVRFRIRRTSIDSAKIADPDDTAYILLDNILVSYPRMTADLRPAGAYFAKSGKDVLGMEGAFVDASGKAVLPVAGDSIYGRAVPEYYVNASTNLTATNFIASARMHYRWRYLNQLIDDKWNVASLDPKNNFRSENALELPAMVGDVEFWFDATISAPYYKYVDYSGQGLADEFVSTIYTEKVTSLVSVASAAESFGYPSAGTNWFVRLREAPADNAGVYVMTKASGASVCETNSMYLVSTNQWRGFVKTTEAIDAGLDFRFEGVKLVTDENGSVDFSTNVWRAASDATDSLPASRGLDYSDGWSTAMCDAKTGYLVFTYDETREAISICRGDWQDFNHWSSAATNLFVGSSIDTNSTTYTTRDVVAGISAWPVSEGTNVNWVETFDVPSTLKCAEVYPRDTPISITNTLNDGWTIENLSWTDQKWAWSGASDDGWGGKSAVQLEGRGKGRLSYVSDSIYPDGLEAITFTARLAQFNEFNNFAYYSEGTNTSTGAIYFPRNLKNYTFATYGALTMDRDEFDYDGDGSLSLVAYYDQQKGAYEARISRGGPNGDKLRIALFKWYAKPGGMACDKIGYKEFPNAPIDGLLRPNNNFGTMCRFYISVQDHPSGGTILHAGVSNPGKSTDLSPSPTVFSEGNYESIVYWDTSDTRLEKGTFGVLSRNCAGMFFKPAFFDKGIASVNTSAVSEFSKQNTLDRYQTCAVEFDGDAGGSYPIYGGSDTGEVKAKKRDAWYNMWVLPPGRTLAYEDEDNPNYWGFTAVTNVSQTIAVQTAKHGGSDWTTITNLTISSFKNVVYTNYVYSNTPCDVRLQVGGLPDDPRLDVTVDDVTLSKWNGEWTANYQDNYGYPSNYVYTSAWVVQDNDEIAQKAVRLQPSRATTDDTPVSLRSAVINGAGLFHFDWRNADVGNVKLLLQEYKYATASMDGRLRYATEASVDSTGGYQWETIETIDIDAASGGKTFFLNRRYDGKNSVVLRLIVAKSVVEAARAGTDPNYGSIEITDSYVWDLPPYDKRSWTGWNFRTEGWSDSKDSMWANLTDYKSGLSGLLNNTIDADTLAEPKRADAYAGHMPYIQSPTFETNRIGSVEFRARLYDPDADAPVGYPALVTVYGAKKEHIDAATGEPTKWTKLADVEVDETVYGHKSVKFKSGDQYCVLRLSVRGVPGVTPDGNDGDTSVDADHNPPLRVAIDDICILERPIPSIRFKKGYARPFRSADLIKTNDPVTDIDTSAEQPILGETFGFQAEIELNDLEGVIVTDDPEKPITVYVAYYPYTDTWGWKNWIETTNEVGKAVATKLVKADGTDLVFRSSLDNSDSFCPAQMAGGDPKLKYWNYRLVQYHFYATYYDTSGELHTADEAHNLEADEWSMPEWNRGFTDPNQSSTYFSAFTLLETLAPKQAWINEVNLADTGGTTDKTNQWIEIAVPTAVDMKGWSVRYYNNFDMTDPFVADLFYFNGNNATSANNATEDSKDYSFYVAISPQTTTISKTDAHAVWDAITYHGMQSGALPSFRPAGFELVRPTGVVEHSVVIQGYNEWENSGNEDAARSASGTNFVDNVLKPIIGGDWVWGEADKCTSEYYGYTVGVTNNMGSAHEDWCSPMQPTPFKINKNQVIGDDWFILPNGGYYRIYANIRGDHITQLFGEETGDNIVMTVSEGTSTNIVYTIDRWYQLGLETDHPAEHTVTNSPVALTDGTGRREYTLELNNISNTVTVTACADIASEVAALIPAGVEGDAYKPAIMKWLADGKTGAGVDFANPDGPLTNAVYRGHSASVEPKEIDLVGMYWLDLDPTQPGWELWGGMGPYSGVPTNRVLAASTTNRVHSIWGVTHTNTLVTAWMMITNTVTGGPAYPPYRLQGLNNEKSDEYTGNNWTSVTFKISMQLSSEGKWRDMNYFIFNSGSFDPTTFTTVIEITDPHSLQSPAVDWGWDKYPTVTPWSKWKIDIDSVPVEPAVLKKEHYLDGEYP